MSLIMLRNYFIYLLVTCQYMDKFPYFILTTSQILDTCATPAELFTCDWQGQIISSPWIVCDIFLSLIWVLGPEFPGFVGIAGRGGGRSSLANQSTLSQISPDWCEQSEEERERGDKIVNLTWIKITVPLSPSDPDTSQIKYKHPTK